MKSLFRFSFFVKNKTESEIHFQISVSFHTEAGVVAWAEIGKNTNTMDSDHIRDCSLFSKPQIIFYCEAQPQTPTPALGCAS